MDNILTEFINQLKKQINNDEELIIYNVNVDERKRMSAMVCFF